MDEVVCVVLRVIRKTGAILSGLPKLVKLRLTVAQNG
jgi:hypothetical protein